ncbi:hypothetical protein [Exiguobacterium sp.]|uniref:hypothetical protein n=1 Tax=Exiguobacterium sp. TaxID=44751 RepID=UPI00263B23AC|nr:hypothetical protein [Exiguobacterium sp.]MCC5891046.1 hypothetical protein [Exiguobacterium sp.]
MRIAGPSIGWMMIAALLLGGCDEQQRVVNVNETEGGDEAIAVAWAYVTARNWEEAAVDGGRNADVSRVVIDDDYELLDDTYKDEEALAVSFEAKPDSVVGVPTVLIAPESNEVVGYMPSE